MKTLSPNFLQHQNQQWWLLPGGAVQRGGWAAGEVLLDALVVTDLGGNGDGGGFGPWGHHGGLSWRGLRLPGGGKREEERC